MAHALLIDGASDSQHGVHRGLDRTVDDVAHKVGAAAHDVLQHRRLVRLGRGLLGHRQQGRPGHELLDAPGVLLHDPVELVYLLVQVHQGGGLGEHGRALRDTGTHALRAELRHDRGQALAVGVGQLLPGTVSGPRQLVGELLAHALLVAAHRRELGHAAADERRLAIQQGRGGALQALQPAGPVEDALARGPLRRGRGDLGHGTGHDAHLEGAAAKVRRAVLRGGGLAHRRHAHGGAHLVGVRQREAVGAAVVVQAAQTQHGEALVERVGRDLGEAPVHALRQQLPRQRPAAVASARRHGRRGPLDCARKPALALVRHWSHCQLLKVL